MQKLLMVPTAALVLNLTGCGYHTLSQGPSGAR